MTTKETKIQLKTDKVIMKPHVKVKLPYEIKRNTLDFESAFGIPIGEGMAVFVPKSEVLGSSGNRRRLTQAETTAGIIVDCENKVWIVETEPVGADRFGIIAHAPQNGKRGWRSRKPVMAGYGELDSDGTLRFNLNTIYDNIKFSPKAGTVSVSGSSSPSGFTTASTSGMCIGSQPIPTRY